MGIQKRFDLPETRPEPGAFGRRGAIKLGIRMFSTLFPRTAANRAWHHFRYVPRHPIPDEQRRLLQQAELDHYQYNGQSQPIYTWGDRDRPAVLLVHGWAGWGGQLPVFIRALRQAGYRVVAFDAPGHGQSPVVETDLVEFTQGILEVGRKTGPLHAAIGHSFGALSLAFAASLGLAVNKLFLIAGPSSGEVLLEAYRRSIGLSDRAFREFRKAFLRKYDNHFPLQDLNMVNFLRKTGCPTLLIHDMRDKEVPYAHALTALGAGPHCRLHTTEGLGHRRILRHHSVVACCLDQL